MLPLKRSYSPSRTEMALPNPNFGAYIIYIYTPDLGFENAFQDGKGGEATKHRLLEEPGGMDFDRRLICYSDYFKIGGDKTQKNLLERLKDKARRRWRVRKKEVAEGEHGGALSIEGAYRRKGL